MTTKPQPVSELQRAFSLVRERFPDYWPSVEESIQGMDGSRHFRLSIVIAHNTVFGQSGATADEAFAALVESYEKPRLDEIERAKELLAANGFEVVEAASL